MGAGAGAWRQDAALGARRAAARPAGLQGKSDDGFGEDWPIAYEDLAPWYDKVDRLLGVSGTVENLPWIPDGIFQRPTKLTCGEQIFKKAVAKMDRHLIAGRAGVTTEGLLHNRYRSRCMGRGRCGRGCDISANFHSPTALIYPAKDTGRCVVRTDSVVSEVLVDEADQSRHGRPRHRPADEEADGISRQGRGPRRRDARDDEASPRRRNRASTRTVSLTPPASSVTTSASI